MLTMSDVAKLCGVSRQTVHAVINNKPGVSEKTRQKILRVVKEHNYRPNKLAAALNTKSMRLVGVTILNIRNPFFADLIQGINRVLKSSDYHLMVFEVSTKDEEEEAIETLLAYQVTGIICSPFQDPSRTGHLEAVQKRGIPLVSIGPVSGLGTHHVEAEPFEVGAQAAQHLIDMGHQRIAYLEGPMTVISTQERTLGFVTTLRKAGHTVAEVNVVACGDTSDDGRRAAMELLNQSSSSRPTAIACFNDMVALGVYEAAAALQLKIPRDVSVTGCDDIQLAPLLGPPLSTVRIPIIEMGETAASMLLSQVGVETPPTVYSTQKFRPEFIVRESVKRIKS
ncbi:LacI family transcriptional regulator [bacterium]|nr:LacI family transcriptional regulator [bacterium]